jgi:hypothetical protein
MKSNLQSIFTDCPHRERRGWGGDAAVSVHAALLLLGGASGLTGLYEQLLDVAGDTLELGCATTLSANNTCSVFHVQQEGGRVVLGSGGGIGGGSGGSDSGGGDLGTVPAVLHNGPGERPDCWLCCAAKAGFGCIDMTTAVHGALPDIVPVNGPSRAFPGSVTWTQVVFAVADALLQAQGPGPAGGPLAVAYDRVLAPHLAFVNARAATTPYGTFPTEMYGDWIALEPSTKLFHAQLAYVCMLLSVSACSAPSSRRAFCIACLSFCSGPRCSSPSPANTRASVAAKHAALCSGQCAFWHALPLYAMRAQGVH